MRPTRFFAAMLALTVSVSVVAQSPSIPAGPPVLVLGRDYHTSTCPKLHGETPATMSLSDAMREGAGPCLVCRPNQADRAVATFAATWVAAIVRELDAKREAVEAEKKRLEEEAKDRAAAAERVKFAEMRARAEADWKSKEAEPLVRVTESQAHAILTDVATRARNNVAVFNSLFIAAAQKLAPEFRGPQNISRVPAVNITIAGPLGQFFTLARERVRKFEPLVPPPAWVPEIQVVIEPRQPDAPDIEKVTVQRNGSEVAPRRAMIHKGVVTFPLSAFEPGPGVSVTLTALSASGSPITRTFGPLELRALQ
jgi:methylphosphotriester-DNA--protein-cysteine methyltransferase